MAAFQKNGRPNAKATTPPRMGKQPSFSPGAFVSEQSSEEEERRRRTPQARVRKAVAVKPKPVRNRDQYTYYEPKEIAKSISREYYNNGDLMYEVKLTSGVSKQVGSPAE